jgi:hypothetical protein
MMQAQAYAQGVIGINSSVCCSKTGTAVGIATAFGAPIGGLLFALEELASSFSQALGWQTFFACMAAVLTLDTARSAQHALTSGQFFGVFDGDASTVFFEACTRSLLHWLVPPCAMPSFPQQSRGFNGGPLARNCKVQGINGGGQCWKDHIIDSGAFTYPWIF